MWFLVVFNDDTRQKRAMSQGDNKLHESVVILVPVEVIYMKTTKKGRECWTVKRIGSNDVKSKFGWKFQDVYNTKQLL